MIDQKKPIRSRKDILRDNQELFKQNLELSDLLEKIVDILGFDKIKDLYIRQAEFARIELDKLDQQPRRQDVLINQIKDVINRANKMGCHDVADLLKNHLAKTTPTPAETNFITHIKQDIKFPN